MARDIAEIQSDLDVAYSARRNAMLAQTYSIESGQGKQSVQRASLKDINGIIADLESELDCANNGGGIINGDFERY